MSRSPIKTPAFRLFWLGQILTQTGSEVSLLALPVVAASLLHCTASQISMLVVLEFLPPILLGLHIGAIFDWYASRALLIASDLARGALLVLTAVLYAVGRLDYAVLCGITVMLSVFRTIFDSGYVVFIKRIVNADQLAETNISLGRARSFAETAGPSSGGFLIAALGAANALIVDAVTFFCSAMSLGFVRETVPREVAKRAHPFQDIAGGARVIAQNSTLKLMIGVSALWNLFYAMMWTLYVVYLLRDMALDMRVIGLTYLPGGIGFFFGTTLLSRLRNRYDLKATATLGIWITVAWALLTATADGSAFAKAAFIFGASFFFAMGQALYNISSMTLRQLSTPDEFMGRVGALASVLFRSTMPLGAMLAGALSSVLTLRQIMMVGTAGLALAALILTMSKVGKTVAVPLLTSSEAS